MTETQNNNAPQAIAIPGFHSIMERLLVSRFGRDNGKRVLDVGAGRGAFSKRLLDLGYKVSACDMHGELFELNGVDFKTADVAEGIPWDGETFDLVLALEITEHVDGVTAFFREANRVLKTGGYFVFSTPNILSLKSRFRSLLTGFFYAFKPLSDSPADTVIDHITPLPFDLYAYRLKETGLAVEELTADKKQRSSYLGLVLYPLIRLLTRLKFPNSTLARQQNNLNCLLGRKLIVIAKK